MSVYVTRTCTEVGGANASMQMENFRERSAYVLLGDPGSAKTTEFQNEQVPLGDAAFFISASDFMTFSSEYSVAEFLSKHPVFSKTMLDFIDIAKQRGLIGLLGTPQTLNLLADVVAHRVEWPDSRLKIFDMACQKMATEQNQEHQIGVGVMAENAVLDAAGYLSVLHLIAEVAGFSSAPNADPHMVTSIHSLTEMSALPAKETMETALRTRLFSWNSKSGHSPAHRQIAEFLAGLYLTELIEDGLPATRVVALLTEPTNSSVVTTLRVLSAWLGAYSVSARRLLIDADPIGVGLYGDIGNLSAGERKRLLQYLYPNHLRPSQIWRYVLPRNQRDYVGRCAMFWHSGLLAKSSDRHIVELLDCLSKDKSKIVLALAQAGFEHLPVQILCSGLQVWGDEIKPSRLSEGLSAEQLQRQTQRHHNLTAQLNKLCNPPPSSKEHQEWEQAQQERFAKVAKQKRKQQSEWAEAVRSHKAELQENRAAPQLLATLAQAYFAVFYDVDQRVAPRDRISEFLGGDAELVDVVLTALREAAFRDDLPEVDRTISLYAESRHHRLVYPVLASIDLLQAEAPTRLDQLSAAQRRKILAVRYCVADTANQEATAFCHDRWLKDDPDLAFDVLYRCAVSALRDGDSNPPGLDDLDRVERDVRQANDTSDGLVSRVNTLRVRLLRAFPVRAPSQQLSLLDHLLGQALRYADRAALKTVVDKKLRAKSATARQKMRWLVAAALFSPEQYRAELGAFIGTNNEKTRHLAEMLRGLSENQSWGLSIMSQCSDAELMHDVIEKLGRLYGPLQPNGFVTLEVDASDRIASMISQLGFWSTQAAQDALTSLLADSKLAAWHEHIKHAGERQ